jgi:thioredoxin 1
MAVIELTKANFKQTVDNNPFVIIDYWAPWCEPCLLFTETFVKVSENHPDIVFGMVNIEEETEIAEFFDVEKIPGVMVIREQASIFTQIGEIGAPALEEIIKWARDYDMTQVRAYYASEAAKDNA